MGLARNQELPKQETPTSEWSFRRLFGSGAASAITKTFTNPFDILLGILILTACLTQLFGRHVSWFFWVLIVIVLLVSVAERNRPVPDKKEKTKT